MVHFKTWFSSGLGCAGFVVGVDDPRVFSNPNDYMLLCLMKMLKRIWPSTDF